ncbi:hypothetical protein BASA81_000619 [Batrachochytrium salamandrivorans]|nr:hypothetical protein BASA81_000619 [Batrachochytrium salamandrivorans]
MNEEDLSALVESPASADGTLRFLANTQQLFEFGLPQQSSSVWRKNLKFASMLFALHEPTKTWRKVQVDAADSMGNIRLAFDTGLEDQKWISRNSVLLREDDPRTLWQRKLEVGSPCDVFLDARWQQLPVQSIGDDKVGFAGGVSLTLTSSPLIAEANTRSGTKPRFGWRGERVPVSTWVDLPVVVLDFGEQFVRLGGIESIIKHLSAATEEFALLFLQALGNGLAASCADRHLLRELGERISHRLAPGGRMRTALPYLETYLRSCQAFTEQEISDMLERAALSVSLALLGHPVHGQDAVLGLKTACDRLFASTAVADSDKYAITRQTLVHELECGGAFAHSVFVSAVHRLVPDMMDMCANRVQLALLLSDKPSTLSHVLAKLPSSELIEFATVCNNPEAVLCAVPFVQDIEALATLLLRPSSPVLDVTKLMEAWFHLDSCTFPSKAKHLLQCCMDRCAGEESELVNRIAEFVTLAPAGDEALRAKLTPRALVRCDAANFYAWRERAVGDLFFAQAVEYWLATGKDGDMGHELLALVPALPLQTFAAALAVVQLQCALHNGTVPNLDVLFAKRKVSAALLELQSLAALVHQYALFPELVAGMEAAVHNTELVRQIMETQLDFGDCWGTRGHRAHAQLSLPVSSQHTVQFEFGNSLPPPPPGYEPVAASALAAPITIQARATVWDLKFLVANMLSEDSDGMSPEKVGLWLDGEFYAHAPTNARFVPTGTGHSIACRVFKLSQVPVQELLLQQRTPPVLSQRAEAALTLVFDEYSSITQVLSCELFCELYAKCTGKPLSPETAKQILAKMTYVENPDLGMQLNEFLYMYALQAVKDDAKVRKDLVQFGFDRATLLRRDAEARLTFDFGDVDKPSLPTATTTFRGEMAKSSVLYAMLHQSEDGCTLLQRLPTDPHYQQFTDFAQAQDLPYLLQVYRERGISPSDYLQMEGLFLNEGNGAVLSNELASTLIMFHRKSPQVATRAWALFFTGQLPTLELFIGAVCEGGLALKQVEQWVLCPLRLRDGYEALAIVQTNEPWLLDLLTQAINTLQLPRASGLALHALLKSSSQAEQLAMQVLEEGGDEAEFYYASQVLLHSGSQPLPGRERAGELVYAKWQSSGQRVWLDIATNRAANYAKLLERDLLDSLAFVGEPREDGQQLMFDHPDHQRLAKSLCHAIPFGTNEGYLQQCYYHSQLKQVCVGELDQIAPKQPFSVRELASCDNCGFESTAFHEQDNELVLQLTQPSLQEQLDRLRVPEREHDVQCPSCTRVGCVRKLREYVLSDSTTAAVFVQLHPTELRRRIHLDHHHTGVGLLFGAQKWRVGAVLYTRNQNWFVAVWDGKRFDPTAKRCEQTESFAEVLDAIATDALVTMHGVTLVRGTPQSLLPPLTHSQVLADNAKLFTIYSQLKLATAITDEARFLHVLRFPEQAVDSFHHHRSITFDLSDFEQTVGFATSMQPLMQQHPAVWQLVLCNLPKLTTQLLLPGDVEYVFDRLMEEREFSWGCELIRLLPALANRLDLPGELFTDKQRFELEVVFVRDKSHLLVGRETAFLFLMENCESISLANKVVRSWPDPQTTLVPWALDRFFAKGTDGRLLQVIQPVLQVEPTLLEYMLERHATHTQATELCVQFLLESRFKLHSQSNIAFVQTFLLTNQLLTLALDWIDQFSPLAAREVAEICFRLPEFEFRTVTSALLQASGEFQLAWLAVLKTNRRQDQVRVLMGLFSVLQQPAASLFNLVKGLLQLPVPRDEDRVTDWVVRFLQRCPAEVPEFAQLAMDTIKLWIELVDNEVDLYSGRELRCPREPANVLAKVGLAEKLEEHWIEHVMLQVLDCGEWLVFWGINGRREAVELALKFDPTGEEGFALPEGLEVTTSLLAGQSKVVFACDRTNDLGWGRFLFTWGLFLSQEEEAVAEEFNQSGESVTFVHEQDMGNAVGAPSPIQFVQPPSLQHESFQHESFLQPSPSLQHESFLQQTEEESFLVFEQQAQHEFGSFLCQGEDGRNEEASWMETGDDPFAEE